MYVEVYSKLVTSSSQKFKETYSSDKRQKYDVAPIYRIETPNNVDISQDVRKKIKGIINEELKESAKMIDELIELEHEDVYEVHPIGKSKTEDVQIGKAYIEDGGIIARIDVDRVLGVFDPSGLEL